LKVEILLSTMLVWWLS